MFKDTSREKQQSVLKMCELASLCRTTIKRLAQAAQIQSCKVMTSQTRGIMTSEARETCVIRRMYQDVDPVSEDGYYVKRLKRRHFVYCLEENTLQNKLGKMPVVLYEDVDGVGMIGDVVDVPKRLVRSILMPSGAAKYPTQENIDTIRKLHPPGSRPKRSIWANKCKQELMAKTCYIPMNPNVEWTLNKGHVRVALRKGGIYVAENCIQIPSEPITGPKEFMLQITMNGYDTFEMKAVVNLFTKDMVDVFPGLNTNKFFIDDA